MWLGIIFLVSGTTLWAQTDDLVQNPARDAVEEAQNSYIFVFDPAKLKSADEVRGRALGLAKAHGAQVRHIFNAAIWGFSATLPKQAAERLAAQTPFISYFEPNGVVWAIGRPVAPNKRPKNSPGSGDTSEPPQVTPYGITRVGGASNGAGLNAWVIDTGIDLDHPDLNVGSGANFILWGKNSPDDGNGHGTHVAGTIAARDNAIDVVGVAAGATVHPIRVLNNSGSGTIDGVVAGIDYVARNGSSGDCANLSLGAKGHFQSLHDAIYSAAQLQGIRFAIAAGNETSAAGNFEPAHVEHANVHTVSAVDGSDTFAWFSNYGNPPVDFAAPGVGVLSTKKGGGVTTLSGTSMAAPHVCGLLLLNGSPGTNGFAIDDPDGNPDPIASK